MKKKYIKPIIECCHLETTIIAGSADAQIISVSDSGASLDGLNSQKSTDKVQKESKDNFWNLWEDGDMEFEL